MLWKMEYEFKTKREAIWSELNYYIQYRDPYIAAFGILYLCFLNIVPHNQEQLETQYYEWLEWSACEVDPLLSVERKKYI